MDLDDETSFKFTIPKPPEGVRVSREEAERFLLEKLARITDEYEDVLWNLAYFYSKTGRQELAQQYVERYISIVDDPEKRAGAYLSLGQLMEQIRNYEAAISYYSQAFSLEPENTATWYLINNNLGFCLNHLGRFAEGAAYCRSAIKIDPARPNGYKNLGIALAGQGHYGEAARFFIQASRVEATDGRSLKLLEQLFQKHPEIEAEIPDIGSQIQQCRKAVGVAAAFRKAINDQHKAP
jgi:tetratricopeptide (TPR) repeat protein